MSKHSFFQKRRDRHLNARRIRKGFQPARKIEEHWSRAEKNLYVTQPRSGLPPWLLPLIILLLVALLVFWAAPTAINRLQAFFFRDKVDSPEPVGLLYGRNVRVVLKPVADIFAAGDIKADRVTQALYNEPVWLTGDDSHYGFVSVRLADGTTGFMRTTDLIDGREAIEPNLYQNKMVVAETTKRILSHARQGTLLVEVPMGTVLFADYRGNGIARVALPDGQMGWLSESGMIVLPSDGQIQQVADGERYFCSTALAFNQITYLPNGQSVYGISTVGIARLAALVNGITLPHLLEDMAKSGNPVRLETDEQTGLYDLTAVLPGDLIFLKSNHGDPARPADLAICVADHQVLHAGTGQTSIRLIDIRQDEKFQNNILFVRRLFNQFPTITAENKKDPAIAGSSKSRIFSG
ncbi:MAG: hypothetical protein ACOX1A_09560 [Saccharofermentanales bacterium]|nr:hypothetical protein [Clostridiaceae bacterium]